MVTLVYHQRADGSRARAGSIDVEIQLDIDRRDARVVGAAVGAFEPTGDRPVERVAPTGALRCRGQREARRALGDRLVTIGVDGDGRADVVIGRGERLVVGPRAGSSTSQMRSMNDCIGSVREKNATTVSCSGRITMYWPNAPSPR